MRYFVAFSYFGKSYHGWQRQPNALSVQETMEKAFSTLLRADIKLAGARRTDAGVHAKQMYAHFDVTAAIDTTELVYRLNSFLPDDIAIHKVYSVGDTAHARFDALERTYEYWVTQRKNPFLQEGAYYMSHPLDVDAMNRAAAELLQHTDFECFSKSNTDVKTYLCSLKQATWSTDGEKLIFTITADRFLRNMVRAIVGTLLDVGLGKKSVDNVNSIIKSKDRGEAGSSVPAKGLYLTRVIYPKTTLNLDG